MPPPFVTGEIKETAVSVLHRLRYASVGVLAHGRKEVSVGTQLLGEARPLDRGGGFH